jgi:DNA-directed RNA polymerase specialized sigma24 family protein
MATTVDHLADSDSPLASRVPELTARFVDDALPYLNQLNERARRMTRSAVDAEDLVQETMLRAYVGFNTSCDGTNLRGVSSAIRARCLLSRYRRTPVPRDRRNHGVLRRHRLVTSAPRAPTIANPVANHTRTGMSTSTTATSRSRCRCRFILLAVGLAGVIVLRPARAQRPTLIATRPILLRAGSLLASWAIGLLVAAWTVLRVSLSVPGFIVAVVVFTVMQAILSLSILKLPHRYASLLLGGTGSALTIVALILGSVLTQGLTIEGMASWLATTVVVWLVTTITLPELLIRDEADSTRLNTRRRSRRDCGLGLGPRSEDNLDNSSRRRRER